MKIVELGRTESHKPNLKVLIKRIEGSDSDGNHIIIFHLKHFAISIPDCDILPLTILMYVVPPDARQKMNEELVLSFITLRQNN